ncbi:MAG: hypothetical protein M1818_007226 [Claussenomyces sp. TS43310]|nr:MAG: hypothetical protein M1818_007226 [Claussenomyces sp. TS43310]
MNFQPQYGNTANGPYRTWYIPRMDPPINFNYNFRAMPAHPPAGGSPFAGPAFNPYPVGGPGQNNLNISVNQGINGPYPPGFHYGYGGGYVQASSSYQGPPPMALPHHAPHHAPQQAPQQAAGGGFWPAPYPYYPGPYIGPTRQEAIQNMNLRAANDKPQDMEPADRDPLRFYEIKEIDGSWTRRNRLTIDSGDIGKVRWYQRLDGTFFGKRVDGG